MQQSSLEIDQRAQSILRSQLPSNWILSEEHPDTRHIDFRLHIVEPGSWKPGGPQIDIQLKGARRVRMTKRGATRSFKTKHMQYWIDEARLPVFLVLVDITTETVFIRFVHDWHVMDAPPNWREKNTVSVNFTDAFNPEDASTILDAIHAADRRMRELRPGSIGAAADQEFARLDELDSRFSYEVTAKPGATNVSFHPKAPVDTTIKVIGSDAVERLRSFEHEGGSVSFSINELQFEDSGIFGELGRSPDGSALTLSATSSIDCELEVWGVANDESRQLLLGGMTGDFAGGSRRRQISASAYGGIFQMTADLTIGPPSDPFVNGPWAMSLDATKWIGCTTSSLQYYDNVLHVLDGIERSSRLEIPVYIHGLRLLTAAVDSNQIAQFISETRFVRFFKLLRETASVLGVDPQIPDPSSLGKDELIELELVALACAEGEGVASVSGGSCSLELELRPGQNDTQLSDGESVVLSIETTATADFLGAVSPKFLVTSQTGPHELDPDSVHQLRAALSGSGGVVHLRGVPAEGCRERRTLVAVTDYDGPVPATSVNIGTRTT